MSYSEILNELNSIGLKDRFVSEYESVISEKLLSLVKNSNEIHSAGSMIRGLLSNYKHESETWVFWQKVLIYFMAPDFARVKNF